MRNNEVKIYKGCKIQKLPKGKFSLNGREVANYEEAKRLVDIEEAEELIIDEVI